MSLEAKKTAAQPDTTKTTPAREIALANTHPANSADPRVRAAFKRRVQQRAAARQAEPKVDLDIQQADVDAAGGDVDLDVDPRAAAAGGLPTVGDVLAQGAALRQTAASFDGHATTSWYDAVSELDDKRLHAAAEQIAADYRKLDHARIELTTQGNLPTRGADGAIGASAASSAAAGPLVAQALASAEDARWAIGRLGLQSYRGQAVFGHWISRDPGADPLRYLDALLEHTTTTIVDARDILSHAHGGQLDATGDLAVGGLVAKHRSSPTEVMFLDFVIQRSEVGHALQVKGGVGGQSERFTVKEARDQLAATRSGLDRVDAGTLAGMAQDAAALVAEIHQLGSVSDERVLAILRKYPPDDRSLFLRLVERKDAVALDNIVHRMSADHIAAAWHLITETPGYGDWRYDEKKMTARSGADQGAYIAEEMARQAPGAICSFIAGFYSAMSGLPIIGGMMGKASDAFHQLEGELDSATGATDIGKGTGRMFSNKAGAIASKLMQIEAGGELKAIEGYEAVATGRDALQTLARARELAHTISTMKGVYDGASQGAHVLVGMVPTAFELVNGGFDDLFSADPELRKNGIVIVEGGVEKLIDMLGSYEKATRTSSGQAAVAGQRSARTAAGNVDRARAMESSPQTRTSVAVVGLYVQDLKDAQQALVDARTAAEQEGAKTRMLAAREKITREVLASENTRAYELEKHKQLATQQAAAPTEYGDTDQAIGHYEPTIKARLKDAAIGGLVSGLQLGLKWLVKKLAEEIAGRPLTPKKALADTLADGAGKQAKELLLKTLDPLVAGAIAKLVARSMDPENAEAIAEILKPSIEPLVAEAAGALPIDSWLADAIRPWLHHRFVRASHG